MKRSLFLVVLAASSLLPLSAHAGISFAPAVDYATGSPGGPGPAAESMTAADVDNDADIDVIAAETLGSGIRVLLNNGSGGFGPAIVTALGGSTGSVSAAYFDGDGLVDLAVATGYQLIVLHGEGNGRFTEVERHPLFTGGQIQAYAFDVTADGLADIVAPTMGGVKVFIGQGNGRVVAGPMSYVAGILTAASKANFDNDGIPDLALADAFGQRAIAMRGNGDGSFTQTASGIAGFIPEDIKAGDFNGDGIDDVALADSFSFTVSVLLSNGQGGFTQATRYPGGLGPVSMGVADFDRDGDLDLVEAVVGQAKLQLFANNGSGQFAAPVALPVVAFPQTPVIADFNLDGRPDIAVAGPNKMSVLRNTSP